MECPKCKDRMEKVVYADIEVDRCVNCKGIWFDALENEKLKELKGGEAIDSGDPAVGAEYNKMGKINCPVCDTLMIRMVDKNQPHIWYEACANCYGVFFDAGEFTDYKQETIADFFKDLAAKERP